MRSPNLFTESARRRNSGITVSWLRDGSNFTLMHSGFARQAGECSIVAFVWRGRAYDLRDGNHVLAGQSRLHGAVEPGSAFERQVG